MVDPRLAVVEELAGRVATSVGRADPASLGWLAGEPGQRVALVLDRLCRMHMPEAAGRCPDCQPHPSGRACRTWDALAEALAGWESATVAREFRLLLRRYGEQPTCPPAVPGHGPGAADVYEELARCDGAMNSDPQLPAVDEFLAKLVRSLAGEDAAVVGESGRRLALMLDRLCRMHRPGPARRGGVSGLPGVGRRVGVRVVGGDGRDPGRL